MVRKLIIKNMQLQAKLNPTFQEKELKVSFLQQDTNKNIYFIYTHLSKDFSRIILHNN